MSDHRDTLDLPDRLRSDAADHLRVAKDCDCRPEDTANWQHARNCDSAAEELDRLRARVAELEAALRELVECKDIKDQLQSDEAAMIPDDYSALKREYVRRRPLAWEKARAALEPKP